MHASRTAITPPAFRECFASKNDLGPPDFRWKPKIILTSHRRVFEVSISQQRGRCRVDLELRGVNWREGQRRWSIKRTTAILSSICSPEALHSLRRPLHRFIPSLRPSLLSATSNLSHNLSFSLLLAILSTESSRNAFSPHRPPVLASASSALSMQ